MTYGRHLLQLKNTRERRQIGHITWKNDFIRKTGSTYRLPTPPEENRYTAIGNIHRKWLTIRMHGFGDMYDAVVTKNTCILLSTSASFMTPKINTQNI